jgi:hypothetical protein
MEDKRENIDLLHDAYYYAVQAENCIGKAHRFRNENRVDLAQFTLSEGQIYATLALAAASTRVRIG